VETSRFLFDLNKAQVYNTSNDLQCRVSTTKSDKENSTIKIVAERVLIIILIME